MADLLKLVSIYDTNHRNVPDMLDLFKQDCIKDNVQAVVTVCFRDGELDVRSFGKPDLPDVLTLLTCAQQMMIGHMEAKLRRESMEAKC